METLALFVEGKLVALLDRVTPVEETGGYDLELNRSYLATVPDGRVGDVTLCAVDPQNPETIGRVLQRFENAHVHTLGPPEKLRLTA